MDEINHIPDSLRRIMDLFASSPKSVKLQALLDYSERLPSPPEHVDTSEMELVPECQTAFLLGAEVQPDGRVGMWFDAPREAPTTRGFASIIAEGLADATAEEILAVPDDVSRRLGLDDAVSPLRTRGMDAILFRLKRQIRGQLGRTEP
jgi:cysteine desulfuration protein SufE